MAVFAVSITKETPWRGAPTEFSNVYHLKTGSLETFDDNKAIDEIVAAERGCHSGLVTFKTARSWGPTEQGQAASKMREVRQLSGTGSMSNPTTQWYAEFAIMVYWPLGRYGVRNHPQYLRKWLHLARNPGFPLDGARWATPVSAELTSYISKVTHVNPLGSDGPYELCTPDGEHLPISDGVIYPYLEHRQLGR